MAKSKWTCEVDGCSEEGALFLTVHDYIKALCPEHERKTAIHYPTPVPPIATTLRRYEREF